MTTKAILEDFIKSNTGNEGYGEKTAASMLSAVRLFTSAMTPLELMNEVFPLDKLDDIIERIRVLYPGRYSESSLTVYKSQINRVVNDYGAKKLRTNSTIWGPSYATFAPVPTPVPAPSAWPAPATLRKANVPSLAESGSTDIALPLRNGRVIKITYPADLSEVEAEMIGKTLKDIVALKNVTEM